ncbi:MAG: SCO family protein [Thermomicrobiales bacterium]|nr:SCO family protein [Thermomicrobiales bacterium]
MVVLLFGTAALWWGSDGFTTFTAESARRLDVARSPRPLPAVALEDQRGETVAFEDFAGKVVLLNFVYTRCTTICTVLGSEFEQLRDEIEHSELEGRVVLVTLTFDPEHDGPKQLARYAERYGGADATWHFVRAPSMDDTRRLLRAMDVVVVADGFGGFVHNAAIHVIDPRGRLVRIVDSDAIGEALALARELA